MLDTIKSAIQATPEENFQEWYIDYILQVDDEISNIEVSEAERSHASLISILRYIEVIAKGDKK